MKWPSSRRKIIYSLFHGRFVAASASKFASGRQVRLGWIDTTKNKRFACHSFWWVCDRYGPTRLKVTPIFMSIVFRCRYCKFGERCEEWCLEENPSQRSMAQHIGDHRGFVLVLCWRMHRQTSLCRLRCLDPFATEIKRRKNLQFRKSFQKTCLLLEIYSQATPKGRTCKPGVTIVLLLWENVFRWIEIKQSREGYKINAGIKWILFLVLHPSFPSESLAHERHPKKMSDQTSNAASAPWSPNGTTFCCYMNAKTWTWSSVAQHDIWHNSRSHVFHVIGSESYCRLWKCRQLVHNNLLSPSGRNLFDRDTREELRQRIQFNFGSVLHLVRQDGVGDPDME